MKKLKIALCALMLALSFAFPVACSAQKSPTVQPEGDVTLPGENEEESPPQESEEESPPSEEQMPQQPPSDEQSPPQTTPVEKNAEYAKILANNVNLRAGAGTNSTVVGQAHKGEIYAVYGRQGNWLKTYYHNRSVYVYADYCSIFTLEKSSTVDIESVVEEASKCLGVPYVYGAVRYLDENGKRNTGFTASKFDCSSLMQYAFKLGANKNLKLTTRTQIYQGVTIKKSQIQRGDLLFFTNSTRYYNSGVERIGHVALYLGDNYILHTASDYAKIEQISSLRWSYYVQAQRII